MHTVKYLCTAVQEGCGYKDTLRAHRYFAPLAKYFIVCITYQPAYVNTLHVVVFDCECVNICSMFVGKYGAVLTLICSIPDGVIGIFQ